MTDWNANIIDEFRSNEGRVGGPFEGHLIVLLHHKGAKSGIERVNPLAAQDLGNGAYAVFGSKGGHDTHPDWYFNLLGNPDAALEVGTQEKFDVKARLAEGDERTSIWAKQKELMPAFAQYEKKTSREIPVFILERG